MTQTVVILAAGLGTRLGRPYPKPLTPLAEGRSILERQIDLVREGLGSSTRIHIVVGFKMELIMESAPDCLFVYNEVFDSTNTSKSLLRALKYGPDGSVLWFNGDVVFDPVILDLVKPLIQQDESFVCVSPGEIGTEEVGYLLNANGDVAAIGKELPGALGEAVGINYISGRHKEALIRGLERCADGDYFERGIEFAIGEGVGFKSVNIGSGTAVEVDVQADLERANHLV